MTIRMNSQQSGFISKRECTRVVLNTSSMPNAHRHMQVSELLLMWNCHLQQHKNFMITIHLIFHLSHIYSPGISKRQQFEQIKKKGLSEMTFSSSCSLLMHPSPPVSWFGSSSRSVRVCLSHHSKSTVKLTDSNNSVDHRLKVTGIAWYQG